MCASNDLFRSHEHVFLGAGHEKNERKTWAVIVLCGVMMVVEIVGGSLFGSLAVVADGLHMSTHGDRQKLVDYCRIGLYRRCPSRQSLLCGISMPSAGLAHLFRTSLMQMLVRMLDATVMSMRMAMRHDCATKAFVDAAELPKGD